MAEIDKTNPKVIRARDGQATAGYYPDSRRITVVADDCSFTDAAAALAALRDQVC